MNHDDKPSGSPGRPILLTVFVLVIAAVVAVGVAGAAFWLHRLVATNRAKSVTLPDGTTVEVVGAVKGTTPFTTDTRWQRLARRLLPARFQGWVPAATTMSCGISNGATLYFLIRAPGAATPAPTTTPGIPSVPWSYCIAEDDAGFRYPEDGGYCLTHMGAGTALVGVDLRSSPRRQPDFTLHLFDPNRVELASLRVPNPVSGPFPEWHSMPLPQTQTNGPVALTLLRLQSGRRQYYPNPKWHLESSDPAWTKAKPRYWSYLDPTGNEGGSLSPREPAWKLHTSVFRTRPQDFSADEQLVVTNLGIPAPGTFLSVDRTANRVGVAIKVLAISGPGTFGLSNGIIPFARSGGGAGHSTSAWAMPGGTNQTEETWGKSAPFALVEVSHARDEDSIEFRASYDGHAETNLTTSGYDSTTGDARMYTPELSPPAAVKSVSIRVTVNRPRQFEFVVSPQDAHPAKP